MRVLEHELGTIYVPDQHDSLDGLYELKDLHPDVVGWGQMALGIVVAFVVAYASIAWLIKFVGNHSITTFVWYRVTLGVVLLVVLGAGWMSAT